MGHDVDDEDDKIIDGSFEVVDCGDDEDEDGARDVSWW